MNTKKVFIIAEAGSNWRSGTEARDLAMAKSLIDVAAEAGADAVKFQTYRADTVYVPNAGESDYLGDAGIRQSIYSIFEDLSMPYDMLLTLAAHCEKRHIEFMSSPFSVEDAEAVDPFVKTHKIASYEITHIRLLEYLARTGKPTIISTGAATVDDIELAVECFRRNGGGKLSLMQCTAKYPAPISSLNLSSIIELQKLFDVPVGLSDHTRDPVIGPVGAAALGASIIEKHFTLSNRLPGPDHAFALEPDELKLMVSSIRKMEAALGSGKKAVAKEEEELRSFAQRGLQAVKDIRKGDTFREKINFDILRPGKMSKGMHPIRLTEVEGRRATRDITLGEGILDGDFE